MKWITHVATELSCQQSILNRFITLYGAWDRSEPAPESLPLWVAFFRQLLYLHLSGIPLSRLAKYLQHEADLIALLNDQATSQILVAGWAQKGRDRQRLFLSRYDVGADVDTGSLQPRLDFSASQTSELFSGPEMGADALRALQLCKRDHAALLSHLRSQAPILCKLGQWIRKYDT